LNRGVHGEGRGRRSKEEKKSGMTFLQREDRWKPREEEPLVQITGRPSFQEKSTGKRKRLGAERVTGFDVH